LTFSLDALSALACYSWPGNVRELRNLIAKLAMGADGTEITADDMLKEISVEKQRKNEPSVPVTNLEGMEEQMIIKALENTGGRRGLAAEQLGILIQVKVRLVWADTSGRAGIRFVVLEPALYEEIDHWTERKMKDEGWELPQ
jgi:transcriptional regulator with PAS, ATPase and Fis domain